MRTAIPPLYTLPVARTLDTWRRVGGRVVTWLKASGAAWMQTRRHHREVALLQTFDERMLRDVGLTRADVQWAASVPFWRDPAAILRDRAGPRGHHRRKLPVPRAPSIVPGLARDLADRSSPEAPGLPALRGTGPQG